MRGSHRAQAFRRALRHHGTTAALCLLSLVAAVVVLLDRGRVSTTEAERRQGYLLPAWRPDDITAIEIEQGSEQLRLAASAGDGEPSWDIVDGEQRSAADPQAVSQLLGTLELARFERRVDSTIDRAELGLSSPGLIIRVYMDPLQLTLTLGATVAETEERYVAVEGPGADQLATYVVTSQLVAALTVDRAALQPRGLVSLPPSELTRISGSAISGPPRWTLAKGSWSGRAAGGFAIEVPSAARGHRADRRVVAGLLVALDRFEADVLLPSVPSPAPATGHDADAGYAPEPFRIALETPRATTKLEVGGICPGRPGVLVIRREPEPLAGCVDAERLRGLELSTADLADLHAVGATSGDIYELQATTPSTRIEVARRDTGWHVRRPAGHQLDDEAVDQWLEALIQLQGEIVPADTASESAAEWGLQKPRAELRIVSQGGGPSGEAVARIEQLQVGRIVDGGIYLKRLEDGAVLRLSPEHERTLIVSPRSFRPLAVYERSLRQVRRVQLHTDDHVQRLVREDQGWRLIEPQVTGLGADGGLAAGLAGQVCELRALRWASERDDGSFGLASPWATIELGLATEPAELRLLLGGRTQGGYFAKHDEDPAVFVVPRSLGLKARTLLLDRRATMLVPQRLVRITLAGREPEQQLVVERRGKQWRVVEGQPAEAGAAGRLPEVLGETLAEAVVRLGPPLPAEGFADPLMTIRAELAPRGDAAGEVVVLRVGVGDVWHNTSVFYVRRAGIEATFAVAQARLRPLLELL